MIGYLEGSVKSANQQRLILLTSGVGYEIFIVGFDAQLGERLELYIYDHVREDRRELFGFKSEGIKQLFERLIDVSGVGTRLAQKILNSGKHEEIIERIIAGDLDYLTTIPGVGKKTGQKIILELKGVLVSGDTVADGDTLEALMSLGYSRQDCLPVLKQITGETIEERVRSALRLLSN